MNLCTADYINWCYNNSYTEGFTHILNNIAVSKLFMDNDDLSNPYRVNYYESKAKSVVMEVKRANKNVLIVDGANVKMTIYDDDWFPDVPLINSFFACANKHLLIFSLFDIERGTANVDMPIVMPAPAFVTWMNISSNGGLMKFTLKMHNAPNRDFVHFKVDDPFYSLKDGDSVTLLTLFNAEAFRKAGSRTVRTVSLCTEKRPATQATGTVFDILREMADREKS